MVFKVVSPATLQLQHFPKHRSARIRLQPLVVRRPSLLGAHPFLLNPLNFVIISINDLCHGPVCEEPLTI